MDEPSPCWDPPVALSPLDWRFEGDILGDSIGSGPEEVPVGSWPRMAWVGEVGAPPELEEPCASFVLEGFGGFGTVLSA
jgi:hypothetical protein